jgi:hypothetical protein
MLAMGGVFCVPSLAWAATCEIADVVAMTEEGRAPAQIRAECGGRVVDGGNCTLTKVMRLAKDGMSEDEISDECTDRSTQKYRPPQQQQAPAPRMGTFCQTNFGACPLTIGPPVVAGGPCYCMGPMGSAPGIAR